MGGAARRRVAVLAGFALAAALVGCSSSASDRQGSSPEPTGPTHPAPSADPSPPGTSSPPSASSPPGTSTVGGWDIHYREDGKIKVLKVEDFPR